MKYLFFILVLLFSFNVYSQDSVQVISDNTIEVTKYYEDGKIHSIGTCKVINGEAVKEGKWVSYHRNGLVSSIVHFKNNLRDGESRFYTMDGKLLAVVKNKKGEVTGYSAVIEGELVLCNR